MGSAVYPAQNQKKSTTQLTRLTTCAENAAWIQKITGSTNFSNQVSPKMNSLIPHAQIENIHCMTALRPTAFGISR